MARNAKRYDASGFINTVWCPYRYLQQALFHGLVFGAIQEREAGLAAGEALDADIAERLFGSTDPRVRRLCRELPLIHCDHAHLAVLVGRGQLNMEQRRIAERTVRLGRALLEVTEDSAVSQNDSWWRAMRLSARTAVHCCRLALDPHMLTQPETLRQHESLVASLEADWAATRFPDDPARLLPRWQSESGQYLLSALRGLAR